MKTVLEAPESNEEWNEWLLTDRLEIIKTVIISHDRPVNLETTPYPRRDAVLYDLLYKAGALNLKSNNNSISVSSIPASKKEKNNPVCSIFDKTHSVIKLFPLKVCSDEWIDWYFNTKMRGTNEQNKKI